MEFSITEDVRFPVSLSHTDGSWSKLFRQVSQFVSGKGRKLLLFSSSFFHFFSSSSFFFGGGGGWGVVCLLT